MSYYMRKDNADKEDLLDRPPQGEPEPVVVPYLTQDQWNFEEERAMAKNQEEYNAMMGALVDKAISKMLPEYVSPAARDFVPPVSDCPREQPSVSFDQFSDKQKAHLLVASHKLDALTFEAYQACAKKTAIYNKDARVFYPALGLTGEVGEFIEKVLQMAAHAGKVANQVKKIIRDDDCECDTTRKDEIAKELGGVLWYLSAVCSDLGLDLGGIAQENLDILASRQKRGVIQGEGDNR